MENILLQDWEYPPFDRIEVADYAPAIYQAIAEAEAAVEAIASASDEPTFENTIEALEASDRRLSRISAVLMNLNECCTTEQMQDVVEEVEPAMTRFAMRVSTDERLFRRVAAVHDSIEARSRLDAEQLTLLDNMHRSFLRHGIGLQGEERERFKRNEEELAELKLRFGRNALADMNGWTLHLTEASDLEGLPESLRQAAAEEARKRGMDGWVFGLSYPMYGPFMAHSRRRDLREQMYRAYGSIGNRGNEYDNNEVIRRIVELRSEQARLLGYATYCDYVLEDRMVQSLGNLRQFMQGLYEAVLPAARRELEEVAALCTDGELQAWDFSFYAEELKRQRYQFDSEQLRPYFPLDAVREGIFALYGRLYGLRFVEAKAGEVPVYHEEVRVFHVYDGDREMGVLYLDMFPRESKRSGAWMTEFRGQHGEVRPQIQVVCNFSRPVGDEPSLLLFSEVETFMHEMGHAMHGMLSEVKYESLSGTNVKRDFVEMPSQVMENWCYEAEFLSTFARHWKTGEALPAEAVEKIRAAQNHLAGWLCLRQLNLGLTDMAFHTASAVEKAEATEADAMTNLLPRVEGCCTATNFSHIFGGGYASGYYGYKWAEVLDADIFYSRFKAEGIFNTDTAASFRKEILSRGGTAHPATLFRNFMGREPDNKALLKRMNLL